MSQKVIIISAFALAVIAAAVFTLTQEDRSQTNISQGPAPNQITPESKQIENTMPGKYLDYSEEAFANTSHKKVLFFHAPWCAQCRSIEQGITEGSVPAGVTIFKVDYDSRQDLRQKYGITLQTSFVVLDDQGNISKKYVAYDDPYFDSVKNQIF